MLGLLAKLLQIVLVILGRKPPAKPARDVLPEESPTVKAIEDARAKAEERFGPRK